MTTPAPKIKAAIPTTIPFGADVVGWCSSCNSVCDTGTIDAEDRYCCGACGDHLIFAAEVLIERLTRAESEVTELKEQLRDEALAFNRANEIVAKLESENAELWAALARMGQAVSDEEWAAYSFPVEDTLVAIRCDIDALLQSRKDRK